MEQKNSEFIHLFCEIAKEANVKVSGDIDPQAKVTSLGIDSVAMMDIIARMEDRFSVRIPDDQLARLKTVADIEEAISSLRQSQKIH